jgi:SOS-response transcriptional repressor LexA
MTSEERERQLMAAITTGRQAKGYPPSMRELAKAAGISLTRVAQLLARCEKKGFITRHRNVARSIVVIEHPAAAKPASKSRARPARSSKTKPTA